MCIVFRGSVLDLFYLSRGFRGFRVLEFWQRNGKSLDGAKVVSLES